MILKFGQFHIAVLTRPFKRTVIFNPSFKKDSDWKVIKFMINVLLKGQYAEITSFLKDGFELLAITGKVYLDKIWVFIVWAQHICTQHPDVSEEKPENWCKGQYNHDFIWFHSQDHWSFIRKIVHQSKIINSWLVCRFNKAVINSSLVNLTLL